MQNRTDFFQTETWGWSLQSEIPQTHIEHFELETDVLSGHEYIIASDKVVSVWVETAQMLKDGQLQGTYEMLDLKYIFEDRTEEMTDFPLYLILRLDIQASLHYLHSNCFSGACLYALGNLSKKALPQKRLYQVFSRGRGDDVSFDIDLLNWRERQGGIGLIFLIRWSTKIVFPVIYSL